MDSLAPISLATALERNAAHTPARTAVITTTGSCSYSDLNAEANRLANAWLDSGATAGDVVCSFLSKGMAFAICFLAAQKAGLVFASLNPSAHPTIIANQLNTARGRYFVLPSSYERGPLVQTITALRPDAQIVIIYIDGNDSRIIQWKGLPTSGSLANPSLSVSVDSACYLNFTSGTTGQPKAAVGSIANIFWNTAAAIEALGLTSEDVHLSTFPAFLHPHELLARSVYLSGATVLIEAEIKLLWDMVLKYGVTCLMANPTIYTALVDYSRSVEESPAYLRIAESGGSIIPLSLAEQAADRLRGAVVTVWGSAETMGIAIASNTKLQRTTDLLLGSVCPHYEAQVVDTTGVQVGAGEAGELRIRGPAVAAGYSTPVLEEQSPFRDGWYYTGDLVRVAADLQLHLVGRRYDMIKCRGFKVYPAEVEAVLRQHPNVRDAAVVGVLDARMGETVAAVVVKVPGQALLVREVLQFCKGKLESYKVPRAVHFVTEIPRDNNGKVLRSRVSTLLSASALE